jgi:two-component system phosphate regulon sensor histidine kinase PhoR
MSKRAAYFLVVAIILLALAVLVPSFAVRAIIALLLASIAVIWLLKSTTATVQTNSGQTVHDTEAVNRATFARDRLFDATMNGMREGLIVVDRDMRVVASNAAALRLFNPARTSIDSQRLTELTRNPAIYSAFLDALQGIERSDVKVETHGPDRLVFDLRVVPLAVANGNGAAGALGVFIDVTRIEKLEQVRQEFLSNVSHELRTPLTAILAFIETLEAGAIKDEEASQRFLSIIRRNASRMHELIDDTLELSAIESGRVHVRAEQVELHPLVNDVISSLASKASEHKVTVTNQVPGDAIVHADARRLEQMLTNLLDNGIKFNREGGSVTVSYEKEINSGRSSDSVSGPRSAVIVRDTGEGIPAQHLERLFERFYRVDRARSREMGGIGLGLAIVKHLARAHGGEVTVTSELGKGSVFTIELPVGEVNQKLERR